MYLNVLIALTFFGLAAKADQIFKSSVEKVHLLELFSTQSCSSCPPAQAWVSTLKRDINLWRRFVPVVYHVDYWNYLGWKDPYSDSRYTLRQREYVLKWAGTAYTPMFVLDGAEDRSRDRSQLTKNSGPVGILKVQRVGATKFKVEFEPTSKNKKALKCYYAVMGNNISTQVSAGENSGKELHHDFLTLKSDFIPLKMEGNRFVGEVSADLTDTLPAKEKSIAFWIVDESTGSPIQATGGILKE